jgi:RecB family exonuclease
MEKIDAKKKERILTLSASKIALWHSCPMAFFLRYVEPQPDNKESMNLTFGKAIHFMLDRFYEVYYKSPDSFANYWKYYWSATCSGGFLKGKKKENTKIIEYPLRGDKTLRIREDINTYHPKPAGEFFGYMKLGENILKNFYEKNIKLQKPVYREKRIVVNIFGYNVIVIFDRIDKLNGYWYITDYKTDKNFDVFIIHRSPQFTICSKAFREHFNETEENILYYRLRTGKIYESKRSEGDYNYLKKLIGTTYQEIENAIDKNGFVPHYGYKCKPCDYKRGCERYSISHDGPKLYKDGRLINEIEFKKWEFPELLVDER